MSSTGEMDYVNDGESYDTQDYQPSEPQDQVIERSEENEKLLASYPIMPDVIAWFEREIRESTNIENITFGTINVNGMQLDTNMSVEVQAYAQLLLKQKLETKFSEFKHLKDNS